MSWMPSFETMVGWVFHVPDTYEMLWWVLICICWFGVATEFRLKKMQKQLNELADKDRSSPR